MKVQSVTTNQQCENKNVRTFSLLTDQIKVQTQAKGSPALNVSISYLWNSNITNIQTDKSPLLSPSSLCTQWDCPVLCRNKHKKSLFQTHDPAELQLLWRPPGGGVTRNDCDSLGLCSVCVCPSSPHVCLRKDHISNRRRRVWYQLRFLKIVFHLQGCWGHMSGHCSVDHHVCC